MIQLINIDILSNLPRILKKLIEQNKINNLFNEEAFIKIIKQTVLINVNNLNLTFNHKVEIYNNVCRDKSNVIIAKEMIYMITIHLYKLILQLRSKINIVS
ncbi:hypothetical protein NEOCIP111885_00277 [Pseudoneobacillus rhizosphaerae]|uniref:Uncharacterized protein n=1 Tax=Pseudoneobacillus rhizosphaerae TaxID=2880968 RepID=A0A9C7G641_9BACI|nr:hypothetical protein NEOCIP111885_00277 [Pseudoneobacillus rhizosphaerae]